MPDSIEIRESSLLTPETIALMERAVWGTDGARYTLTDIEPTLRHLPGPSYITLKNNGTLIGARMLLEKNARFNSEDLHCFYHSMFCIDCLEKGRGFGKKLARATLESLHQKLGPKGLLYCHVEADNLNSLRISESLGYLHVGHFSAMTFSRFFPKASAAMTKLVPGQQEQVIARLNAQYKDHAMTDFALSLRPDSYYVLMNQGRVLAGLQADLQRWKIHSLAGAGGMIALHALPRIPFLRDLFNPDNFRFIKIGNVFFEKDHPEKLFDLLEAVLAHHHLKTAMMFWDKESPVYKQFASVGRFGILNSLTETPVHILALFKDFRPNEIAEFRQRPKVISPSDI